MSCADQLVAGERDLWARLAAHPFVLAVGDGTLPAEAFDRWLVADHTFVVGYRRFLAQLVALAPDEPARDLLAGGLGPLQGELDLFRSQAAARGLDLGAEPGPVVLAYTSWLQASVLDGFPVALVVLYGAERAYFDAWRAVRDRADRHGPYWPFVDRWSAEAFGAWVAELGGLLDRLAPGGPTAQQRAAFGRVVRLEWQFWDEVWTPAT
jgi:thiaminase/transcriptional activator TenA